MGKRIVRTLSQVFALLVCLPLLFSVCSNPTAVAQDGGGDTVYVHDTIRTVSFASAWTWNFFDYTVHDGTSWRMWSPVVSCGSDLPKLWLCHRDSASWRPFDTVKKYYPIAYSGQAWLDGYQILLADPGKAMQNWKWKIIIETKP